MFASSAVNCAESSASAALIASDPTVVPNPARIVLRSADIALGSKLVSRLGVSAAAEAALNGSGLVSGAARNHSASGVAAFQFHSLLVASVSRSFHTNMGLYPPYTGSRVSGWGT